MSITLRRSFNSIDRIDMIEERASRSDSNDGETEAHRGAENVVPRFECFSLRPEMKMYLFMLS